ncbi:MAG: hypothetical protein RLY16_807, partial [Bacteroidota bacterium]
MFRTTSNRIAFLLASTILLLGACRKRDAILPDNLVNFETTTQGITATENSATVKLSLTRGTTQDIPVVIKLNTTDLVYGTDYTTTPAATANGEIALTIPSGNNEATFTVNKVAGALFDGDEKITFNIYSSGSPILIGLQKQIVLSFAELVSAANAAIVNGGGVYFPNKVFIDFSANRQ